MKIVVPKETYPLEKRVMVLPSSAKEFVNAGHQVFVQSGAAEGIMVQDTEYKRAGATIISEPRTLYELADMTIKVKAPSPEEFSLMHKGLLFCMLHIGQNKERLFYMASQRLLGIAMEDIRDAKGKRLVDQTHVTGEAGVYYALRHFERMPYDMQAVILGYGNVATGAITACSKLGISYKIMRRSEFKHLPKWLQEADLLINAVTWPENKRKSHEYLVTREMIKNSKPGMIVLDLAVDFPNPVETVHPTDYSNPYYLEEDHVHISIYGYPGLVPISSSQIYNRQVLPLALAIANNKGLRGIGNVPEVGKFIHDAIIDPKKYGWQRYKPEELKTSKIE